MHDDFFNTIHQDHVEVRGIISQLKSASDAERESLFKRLKSEILPHMKAEESAFYPPLEQNSESHEDALEAFEEHHAAELFLTELDKMPKQGDKWKAKLSVFSEIVEHHIEEEEEKIFKDAEKVLSHDKIDEVSHGFQEEKQKVKKTLQ